MESTGFLYFIITLTVGYKANQSHKYLQRENLDIEEINL